MTLSMYQASAPVFVRGLNNLSAILAKAQAEVAAGALSEPALMEARLASDMFPLPRQVQIASDLAKAAAARLADLEPPAFEDTETTLAELQQRIAKTIAYVATVKADQVDGSEDKTVVVKTRNGDMTFKGQPFLLGFALPNFYFHLTTTYAILRHKGLALTKQDFIGGM